MTDQVVGQVIMNVEGGVATLRLTSPARRNAISSNMWRSLADFAGTVSMRHDIRVVLIRGDGNAIFSSGADISDFDASRSGGDNAQSYDDLVEETCCAIEAIAQPTIAMIQGRCMGAGASLAFSCDLRVASHNSEFAVPAANLGLGYDPRGIARFVRQIGAPLTTALLFTAEVVPGSAIQDTGGIQYLTDAGALEGETTRLIDRIARNAPLTLRAAKLVLRSLRDPAMQEQARLATIQADLSADYREGRAAFREKRSPRFTGA